MPKPKYDMEVCRDGECRSLGRTRSIEKAKRKIAREVERLRKRFLKGKSPTGTIRGSVRDENGVEQYRAHAEYGPPTPAARPRRRRDRVSLPPMPPLPPLGDD